MLQIIQESWGWTGLEPVQIIAINQFGNIIVTAVDGAYWRICPEELNCVVIAAQSDAYSELSKCPEFNIDWEMAPLVRLALDKLGPVQRDRCYCLKLPAVLGGAYDAENIGTISVQELIQFSGDLARRIKDLPDGAKIRIKTI